MTPSSPFHPPGNHPHPFFSYTGNLGVIGEPPGSRRQTPTPEAAVAQAGSNGEILLQLLQQGGVGVVGGGTGFGKSVGDGRYPGGQHSAAEDGGAGASWAADPALAALGPGHPYHQHKQHQLQQQQQQQQKAITPEDILQSALLKQQAHHGIPAGQANFQHPAFYGAGVGQATAPAGRAPQVFHQHQPAPVLPQSFSSRYGGKHIVNELHRNPEPSWVASQQVRQVAPEPGNPLGGRSWTAPPPAAQQQQHQRLPQAQFHGNGPELLQLLLGSTGGSHVVVSSSPALRAVDLGKPAGQKPAPPVMHGPIGPPKRSEVPADDALGRSWSTSSSSSNGGLDLGSAPGSLHPEALSFDRSALRERLLQSGDLRPPVGVDRHGGDLRILGSSLLPKDLGLLPESEPSGYPFPSILLPESLELKDGNTFGWMGLEEARIFAEREVPQGLAQLQRVMGNHLTHGRVREIYLKNPRALEIHVPSSVGLPDAHENQYKEQFDSESSRELSRDMMRGGRRPVNTVARAEAGRRGGRNSAGQWVVVNDRQREKDVEAVHSAIAGAKDQVESLDKGQYVIGNLQASKDENRLRSEEGGQQKVRDDLKRRRGQQQEWRMKQPTHGSIQTFRHVSDPQSLDGVQSPSRALKDVNGNGASAPSQAPSLTSQLDNPGLPVSNVSGSTPGSALEESLHQLNGVEGRGRENGYSYLFRELTGSDDYIGKEEEEELLREFSYLDMADEQETSSLHDSSKPLTGGSASLKAREEGEQLSQYPRRGTSRADSLHRPIVEDFTPQLLNIYDSLIPLEDEEKRRRKFLSHLDNIVAQEWPGARLFLFGSCANAFGVCNSDIDICLSVNDEQTGKAELVTRMASILRLHSMQNVQALTHARVPIVKFTDSVTGISCDICVNNMLAVVNSKLLHDYSKVDVRLRQLAFIVKHWAKRRQVNETYRGTLSSYAYVLMCIHFLQQRQPAILPCLQQGMPITYKVKIGRVECAYYDKVETLTNFGSQNKEGLGELVTAFFEYWAFHHDYNRAVISVRTGTFLSKDQKDWTRRVGNERHLICIEDPFEVTHDLGRIVDRHSIRVLRDEFYRAAKIMRHDSNACVTLFEPFIRQ